MAAFAKQIRGGEHKTWEIIRARPLTIHHAGRFRGAVTLRPARGRAWPVHPAPDIVANVTGKDAGFVLRYFAGLVAMKLGKRVAGFYIPVELD